MKLLGLLVLVGLVFCPNVTASVAAADPDSCSQMSYTVWENTNYTGDGLHVCYNVNLPDLSKVTHTQAGICYAPFKAQDTWDDCINSVRSYLGSENHAVCLYVDRNYSTAHGWTILFAGGQLNFPIGTTMSDSISSIKWC